MFLQRMRVPCHVMSWSVVISQYHMRCFGNFDFEPMRNTGPAEQLWVAPAVSGHNGVVLESPDPWETLLPSVGAVHRAHP